MTSVISDNVLLIGLLEDPGNYYRCESVPRAVPVRVTQQSSRSLQSLDAGLRRRRERVARGAGRLRSMMVYDSIVT
jgi:hypothetical protein